MNIIYLADARPEWWAHALARHSHIERQRRIAASHAHIARMQQQIRTRAYEGEDGR